MSGQAAPSPADLDKLEQAFRAAVLARAPGDYPWFIKHFVKIEIKGADGGIDYFRLWPFQVTALHTFLTEQRILVLKARQLGLSWLVLAYSLCRMLFRPGYRIAAISKTDDESKEMARRLRVMLENLPDWIIRPHDKKNRNWGGPTFEANTDRIVIHFPPRGEQRFADSIFVALPQSADSGRSLTGHLLILDEFAAQEFANQIWAAAGPTINDGAGQAIIISTGKRNTKFEELCNQARKGEGRFKLLFFPWHVRPDRDEAWYENTKLDFPNDYRSEYPRTEDEAFTAGVGRFFPEWDEDVHVLPHWEPPMHWPRYGAYDPGYSSWACFKCYAVDPDGHYAVCYRELYMKRMTDEQQADLILEKCRYPDGSPEVFEWIISDREAWNASSEAGQSTAEIFAGKGIGLVPAAKSKLALRNGWRRLHGFLRVMEGPRPGATPDEGGPLTRDRWARLMFTEACPHSRRTYPACVEATNDPDDISRQSEHHAQDCDRMFCYHYPLEIPGVPTGTWDAEWGPDPALGRKTKERELPWPLQEDRAEEPADW